MTRQVEHHAVTFYTMRGSWQIGTPWISREEAERIAAKSPPERALVVTRCGERFCKLAAGHPPPHKAGRRTWRTGERKPRKKGWSINDADHVPNGAAVFFTVDPKTPSMRKMCEALGLELPTGRTGVVKRRQWGSGSYLVAIDGTRWTVAFKRGELVFPVEPGMLAFDPDHKRKRRC